MAFVRWTFYDPTVDETYQVEVNPKDGFTPGIERTFTKKPTSAPTEGRVIIFEGGRKPQDVEWTGTILTEAYLDALTDWAGRNHQIRVSDDLGRQFWILFESFVPKRAATRNYPWRHTYTAKATVFASD